MPKITRIGMHAIEYVLPPEKAYGMARGLNFRRTCALMEVETDAGVVGYGEAGGPVKLLHDYLALVTPFFVGRSVFDFEHVATHLYNKLYHMGVQGLFTACLSGISIATLDAAGKALGTPVYNLIGGRATDRFPCYATTGYFTGEPKNELERQLTPIVGKFRAAKIKIGRGPADDVARVRLAREILGDDVMLMVDVNGNYTPDIAFESMRRIEPFNIHWYEEPVPPHDVRGYAELRARAPMAISGGEAFYTAHDFKRVVDARGLDILMPALITCGGFGQARAIAQLAVTNNLRLSPSVWGSAIGIAASLHFAASVPVAPHSDNIPYPLMIEFDTGENPLRDRLTTAPPMVVDGHLAVPDGPGLGIEIRPEAFVGPTPTAPRL